MRPKRWLSVGVKSCEYGGCGKVVLMLVLAMQKDIIVWKVESHSSNSCSSGSQCMPQNLLFLLLARNEPERIVNRILRGKDTSSHSKVEYCY